MTYNQAIDWLFKVPLSFNRDFHNYKLKLEPVIDFCNRVDNPQSGLKIIHVAGTNGKGSTCHITASIIQEHGKNVGIFSSPHLIDFRERIKINGKYIDKRFVTNFINKHKSYIEENKISFFEILPVSIELKIFNNLVFLSFLVFEKFINLLRYIFFIKFHHHHQLTIHHKKIKKPK